VLASDGAIGGYSSGLDIKHRLLALEGVELDL
jgi:O6-methylguanine-DNA--protein-cysteine methyltransferase